MDDVVVLFLLMFVLFFIFFFLFLFFCLVSFFLPHYVVLLRFRLVPFLYNLLSLSLLSVFSSSRGSSCGLCSIYMFFTLRPSATVLWAILREAVPTAVGNSPQTLPLSRSEAEDHEGFPSKQTRRHLAPSFSKPSRGTGNPKNSAHCCWSYFSCRRHVFGTTIPPKTTTPYYFTPPPPSPHQLSFFCLLTTRIAPVTNGDDRSNLPT